MARPSMVARHDTEGPRVRLGVAWFLVVLAAALAAAAALGVVLAVAAALAAEQVVRLRAGRVVVRRGGRRLAPPPAPVVDGASGIVALRAWGAGVLGDPSRLTAVLGGAALPLAAMAGPDTLTAAFVAVVALALAGAALSPAPGGPGSRLAAVGSVVAATVVFGGAAAAVVVLREEGVAAAVILIVLVSAYEAGDYLVGAGSSTVWEGPAAGIAATVVLAFGASLVALVPLGRSGPLVLAGVVAIAAPVGPLLVSTLLGDGRNPARFARRLDAWVAVAPIAAWVGAAIAG